MLPCRLGQGREYWAYRFVYPGGLAVVANSITGGKGQVRSLSLNGRATEQGELGIVVGVDTLADDDGGAGKPTQPISPPMPPPLVMVTIIAVSRLSWARSGNHGIREGMSAQTTPLRRRTALTGRPQTPVARRPPVGSSRWPSRSLRPSGRYGVNDFYPPLDVGPYRAPQSAVAWPKSSVGLP